jgi:cytochrome c oxidase assembly protein subunit 11
MTDSPQNPPTNGRHGLTAALCVVFVAGMVGMSFAAVPLYRIFCQATGYDGTPRRAEAAPGHTLDRTITVRFDGNIANGLAWSFRPKQREVKVHVGEVVQVAFIAENRGTATATGTATFNVTPETVGAYFNKIACFCFTEQTLAAGQTAEMPVQFFIDPAIADAKELNYVDTVTLSYTFFPSANPAKPVAAIESNKSGSPL